MEWGTTVRDKKLVKVKRRKKNEELKRNGRTPAQIARKKRKKARKGGV